MADKSLGNACDLFLFGNLTHWNLFQCIVDEMIVEESSAPSGEVIETDGFEQAGLETLAPLESIEEVDADVDQLRLARM